MGDMQIVVANDNKSVEAQFVELMVPLYSYGCERKVKKAFSNFKGIYSVNVDYNQQKVTVWGICNKYDVLETIRSKRKEARFWNSEDDNNNTVELQSISQPNSTKKFRPSKPYLTLIRAQSFNWKALKKVFTRSYSF